MSKFGLALREDGLQYIDTAPRALNVASRGVRRFIDLILSQLMGRC